MQPPEGQPVMANADDLPQRPQGRLFCVDPLLVADALRLVQVSLGRLDSAVTQFVAKAVPLALSIQVGRIVG